MKRTAPLLPLFVLVAWIIIPAVANAQVCNAENGFICPSGYTCNTSTETCGSTTNTGVGQPTTNVNTGQGVGGGLLNPLGTTDLEALVLKILAFIIRIGAIVVIFMLVYVGFLFVTARGEPAKLSVAKSALLWTIVGALILLGSQAISLAIQATVGAISAGG